MSAIKDRFQHLRVGEAVDRGEFVLDEKQARKKLQQFQLPSPHHYLLEFAKAAHLLNAQRIEFIIGVNEVELAFDGDALTPDELEILDSAPFSQHKDERRRALRHLAIGANSARGLGLREFTLEISGEHPHGVCIVGQEISAQEVDIDEDRQWVTRIYLRRRLQLDHLLRFVDSIRGTQDEVALLKNKCRFSRRSVTVNGERISSGFHLPDSAQSPVEFSSSSEEGVLGIELQNQHITAHLLQNGVLVETATWPARLWASSAVVESERLTTNLSQSAFIEDQALHDVRATIEEATIPSLQLHFEQKEDRRIHESVHLAKTVFAALQKIDGRSTFDPTMERFLTLLSKGTTDLPYESTTNHSIQRELHRISLIHQKVRDWRKRPLPTTPDEKIYAHHKSEIFNEVWTITAALRFDDRPSEVLFIKEGHLLERHRLTSTDLTGLSLQIDGPISVTEHFDCDLSSLDIEQGVLFALGVLWNLLAQISDQLPQDWQQIFIGDILSGTLHDALLSLLKTERLEGLSRFLPARSEVEQINPDGRLELLRSARHFKIFADVHKTQWSLAGLWMRSKIHGLGIILVHDAEEDLPDNDQLQRFPILDADPQKVKLVTMALDLTPVPVAQYLIDLQSQASTKRTQKSRREHHRKATLQQKLNQWKSQPCDLMADHEIFPHQATMFILGGSSIVAALSPTPRTSELLFIKDNHLLQRRALESMKLPGLSLRIEISDALLFFETSHRAPWHRQEVKEGSVELIKLLEGLVNDALPELDENWQLTYLEEFLSGNIRTALLEGFQWKQWPSELRNCFSDARNLGLNRNRRIEVLGAAGGLPLFADIQGKKWSLSSIWDNHFRLWRHNQLKELDIFAVATTNNAKSPAELRDHIVFAPAPRRLKILSMALNFRELSTPDYLEKIGRDDVEHFNDQPVPATNPAQITPPTQSSQKTQKEPAPKKAKRRRAPKDEQFLQTLKIHLQDPNHPLPPAAKHATIINLIDDNSSQVVLPPQHRIALNRNHPVLQYALEFPEDPVPWSLLLMAIDSAFTDDTHEDAALIKNLAAGMLSEH